MSAAASGSRRLQPQINIEINPLKRPGRRRVGDTTVAAAILDRLLYCSVVLNPDGDS